jgi:hypothetical protein
VKNTPFSIEGLEIQECPRSYITPRSTELVNIFGSAQHATKASGAALYGPDLAKWPAWAVDACVVLEIERILEHNARIEAQAKEE